MAVLPVTGSRMVEARIIRCATPLDSSLHDLALLASASLRWVCDRHLALSYIDHCSHQLVDSSSAI